MNDVVLDISRLVGRKLKERLPTGVDRVCLAYLEHYDYAQAFLHVRGQGIILTPEDSTEIRKWLLNPDSNTQADTILWRTKQLSKLILRRTNTKVPQNAWFFNVGHSGLEYRSYIHWLKENAVRPIYMVHDLIPITHPEYCRDGEFKRHTNRMNAMLHTASGIISNSQDTLNELSHFANKQNYCLPPAIVAHLGVTHRLMCNGRPQSMAAPYFTMLGTIEPRKNHLLILNVWRKLVERYGENTPKLVLIGQRGWECEQVIDMLERCPLLRNVVLELPNVSDHELAALLEHTKALLFPSFVEGFGLPLIEAIEQGITVLASNLSVFREIAGDTPHYFDPLDGLGWMAGIEAAWRGELIRKIPSSALSPTSQWSDHFQQIDTWLEQV